MLLFESSACFFSLYFFYTVFCMDRCRIRCDLGEFELQFQSSMLMMIIFFIILLYLNFNQKNNDINNT